jgi:hypothetical protein
MNSHKIAYHDLADNHHLSSPKPLTEHLVHFMVASVAKSGRKKRHFEPHAEPDLKVQEVSAKIDVAAAYPYNLEFDYMKCAAMMGTGFLGRTA